MEAEIRYDEDILPRVSREVLAPERHKLRQRHGMEAGYLRFVAPLPGSNENSAMRPILPFEV